MSHETAMRLLSDADSSTKRVEAVREALRLGMPLSAIEQHLDWLDQQRESVKSASHYVSPILGGQPVPAKV